jgi:hypothetical protein
MHEAIRLITEEGASIKDAAAAAGLTYQAIYLALRRPNVREFFYETLKPVRIEARALALHALRKEMLTSDNAASRVAAARTLLADEDVRPGAAAGHEQPNFIIMVQGSPPPPVTIEHQPAEPARIAGMPPIGDNSLLRDRPEVEPEEAAAAPLRWDSQLGRMVNGRRIGLRTAVHALDQYGRRR